MIRSHEGNLDALQREGLEALSHLDSEQNIALLITLL
jgi:hypothetical protein